MNVVEKILASRSGKKEVKPGEIITAKVDLIMGNDLSASIAIDIFQQIGAERVFDSNKIAIVFSHFVPAKDILTAILCDKIRRWVDEYKIRHFYEVGKGGIEHVVLPDEGLILPGTLIVGGDSHSTTYGALGCFATGIGSTDMAAVWITGEIWLRVPETIKIIFHGKRKRWVYAKDMILQALKHTGSDGARYKAVEFAGPAIASLDMSGRFTICNMTAEMGAKAAYVQPDNTTLNYLKSIITKNKNFEILKNDSDANYEKIYEFDIEDLEPQIACPFSPDNVKSLSEIGKIEINQVNIGSCTNGRYEDLKVAAEILKARRINSRVRMIVTPASQRTYMKAIQDGIIQTFVEAGAAVSTPTCGACLGGHMGVLAPSDVCLSTTNRNYPGRMGHVAAKIYLSNPAVAAASAITGYITHPEEVVGKTFVPSYV